jgi:hypothetical protein
MGAFRLFSIVLWLSLPEVYGLYGYSLEKSEEEMIKLRKEHDMKNNNIYEENQNTCESNGDIAMKSPTAISKMKSFKKYCILTSVVMLTSVFITLYISGTSDNNTIREAGKSISPKEIIETFEISSLEYRYSNVIFESNTTERKFLFIPLTPATQMYAVRYDGSVKMGINGKDIKIQEQYNGGDRLILRIIIPKADIISHDAPLNNTCEVIYDVAIKAEAATIGQYIYLFNESKIETEEEIRNSDLLDNAQESAKKQLEILLNAIPDINSHYIIEFELKK